MASQHLSNTMRKVVVDFILSTSDDMKKVIKTNLSMIHNFIKRVKKVSI